MTVLVEGRTLARNKQKQKNVKRKYKTLPKRLLFPMCVRTQLLPIFCFVLLFFPFFFPP